MYVNKIAFKVKTGYYLDLLTPETMKLYGSTKKNTTEDKNDENAPHLEITEVLLVHCNIVYNDYQINPKNFIFLKTFDSEFSNIEVWLTDQNSKLLEI